MIAGDLSRTAGGGTQRFAFDPADDRETRRQKQAILVVAGGCSLCGIAWTAMYWFVFGWCLTTVLPLLFTVIVGSALVVSHRTRDHRYAVYAQILCIMYITALIQWTMGDVFASGFVLAWALCAPITALAFFPLRRSAVVLALYLVNLAITLGFDGTFARHGLQVSERARHVFFAMNLGVSSLVVFFFATYFAQSADSQRARADRLQSNLNDERAKQLGPYTLEEELGAGGMGVVYKARHALLRRPTAVKLLPVDKIGEQSLARFECEVQNTARLTHPNTVSIYDYGRSTDGDFYYAMEFLDGVDLDALVARSGPLPPARVVYILRQVCDALDEAHQRALVHRDVKPANIMLCRMGNRADVVKVLDFGLVKELEVDSRVSREGAITGTPAFMAPESIDDPTRVGPATDLYAVGAVAYWLLTGRHVFEGETILHVFVHHLHSKPTPPSRHVAGIPDALDRLIHQCLAKDPRDRPSSAAALVRSLDALAAVAGLAWTSDQAHAWWDAFERERAKGTRRPASPPKVQLTVDIRARGADAAATAPSPARDLALKTTVGG